MTFDRKWHWVRAKHFNTRGNEKSRSIEGSRAKPPGDKGNFSHVVNKNHVFISNEESYLPTGDLKDRKWSYGFLIETCLNSIELLRKREMQIFPIYPRCRLRFWSANKSWIRLDPHQKLTNLRTLPAFWGRFNHCHYLPYTDLNLNQPLGQPKTKPELNDYIKKDLGHGHFPLYRIIKFNGVGILEAGIRIEWSKFVLDHLSTERQTTVSAIKKWEGSGWE